MPKYYCDYCDITLTHDSPSVRKKHCLGRKHLNKVKKYYQNWMDEQVKRLVNATTTAYNASLVTNMATHSYGTPAQPTEMWWQHFATPGTTRMMYYGVEPYGAMFPMMMGPYSSMTPRMGMSPTMMGMMPMGPMEPKSVWPPMMGMTPPTTEMMPVGPIEQKDVWLPMMGMTPPMMQMMPVGPIEPMEPMKPMEPIKPIESMKPTDVSSPPPVKKPSPQKKK